MAQCSEADGTCDLELFDNQIICKKHDNNTEIVGKLYATTTGNSFDTNSPNITYNPNSGLREPTIITDNSDGEGTSYDGNTGNLNIINSILRTTNYTTPNDLLIDMKNDYAKMIQSVEKFNGFYISRYEISKDSNNKLASVKDVVPLVNDSNTTWYELYAYGKTYNTESVTSSMVWGSQYDLMMRWMFDNGNGTDIKNNIGDNRNKTEITGNKRDSDIIKNIYDLYGCHLEWTLEANNIKYRIRRGRCLQLQLFT